MDLKNTVQSLQGQLKNYTCQLIAVSKTHPPELISEAYQLGLRRFGENKVQELLKKQEVLPKDIEWHLLGHLQTNKVKYIAPFIALIQSVDSFKLLKEIDKEAAKNKRIITCLLQIHIAEEESKFGFSFDEAYNLLKLKELEELSHIKIVGCMGMATFTDDQEKIRNEFRALKNFFEQVKSRIHAENINFKELSMGMSSDYQLALEEGSTMIRIGSAVFGERNY